MPTDQEALRRNLCLRGQLVARGPDELYIAFDGKVYVDSAKPEVGEAGDYFEFMADVREGKRPNVFEADNLTRRCYDLMLNHIKLASEYEKGGNTEGARYLRYVGNMLAALLRGQEASTILR